MTRMASTSWRPSALSPAPVSTSNNAAIGSYFDALRDPLNVGTATEITDVITELLTTNSNLNDFFDAVHAGAL